MSNNYRKYKAILLRMYQRKCYYCKKPLTLETVTIDHFIPQSKGGKNNIENLYPSCGDCNTKKGNSILDDGYKHKY